MWGDRYRYLTSIFWDRHFTNFEIDGGVTSPSLPLMCAPHKEYIPLKHNTCTRALYQSQCCLLVTMIIIFHDLTYVLWLIYYSLSKLAS